MSYPGMFYPQSPDELTTQALRDAKLLRLCQTPHSSAALALIDDLAGRIEGHEARSGARQNARREAGRRRLHGAVGAIIGAMLEAWAKAEAPQAVYRSYAKEGFTGAPVGSRPFTATMDALVSLGLIHRVSGKRFAQEGWEVGEMVSKGWAARFWPTAELVHLAVKHGVVPETVRDDFRFVPPSAPPKVTKPVELRPFEPWGWGRDRPLPRTAASEDDPQFPQLVTDVDKQNAFAATFIVEGCTPPRWRRVFHGTWDLHGRWYAAGSDGAYQTLKPHQRADLTIQGEPVVELDVKASHLTALRGLSGLGETAGDPYYVEGLPRDVAKRWVLETLGKGRSVERWAAGAPETVKAHDPKAVKTALLALHPCLADPASVVPVELPARLDAAPADLLWHYLAAKEAEAMTEAVRALRQLGILGLPVHDSLIVPARAHGEALEAMVEAFRDVCGIAPQVESKKPLRGTENPLEVSAGSQP
ncbi:hypothetical protein [Roseomonas harenae]|uniref:hypothetical protein n=1 Tax=Muricoccus harenae TaxID=2692566 RepID=UPI00133151CD|nr:hypothetical protein [Roseomonas harenae]